MSYDSFRPEADENVFMETEKPAEEKAAAPAPRLSRRRGNFLGMTAVQRFVIAAMLLVMTCMLGAFCLLVTQKVVPIF